MPRAVRRSVARTVAMSVAALLAFSACTTTPSTPRALLAGQEASIEGEVLSVDTAPWAYDGNAVVAVATATSGTVRVQLPARWNLCRAQPHEGIQELKPGDRVRAVGTVAEDGSVVVCAQPLHLLRKLD